MGLLAHQGGWDEILLVLGPIVLISGLLVLAKRRVDRAASRPIREAAELDPAQLDPAQRDPNQRDPAQRGPVD
jgi:hypothetical protein